MSGSIWLGGAGVDCTVLVVGRGVVRGGGGAVEGGGGGGVDVGLEVGVVPTPTIAVVISSFTVLALHASELVDALESVVCPVLHGVHAEVDPMWFLKDPIGHSRHCCSSVVAFARKSDIVKRNLKNNVGFIILYKVFRSFIYSL